ncbi:MAG: hypothetical protein HRT81_10765 [Henriciella sp.]|nr:hypothetical protein [Henriciella sp.]
MVNVLKSSLFGILVLGAAATSATQADEAAAKQPLADGQVVEHLGETGDLIVLRDGVVYYLSTGDDLFHADILRSENADVASVTYSGCTFTLPEKEDVTLDDEFCAFAMGEEPSMAQIASEGGTTLGATTIATNANAPFIIGGVVLSAGGIAAATNGGNGGTGSVASAAAGAPQANSASN